MVNNVSAVKALDNVGAIEAFIEEVASCPGNNDPNAMWPGILVSLSHVLLLIEPAYYFLPYSTCPSTLTIHHLPFTRSTPSPPQITAI